MRATRPHVEIPGDNNGTVIIINDYLSREVRPRIMARAGECMGMSRTRAVWRFGFLRDSEAGQAYGVHVPIDRGPFFWYLTDRKTGDIHNVFEGAAIDLPDSFTYVIGWDDRV